MCSEIISIKDAKVRGLLIEKFVEVAKVSAYSTMSLILMTTCTDPI